MTELGEYRSKLMDRMTAAVREFREACLAVEDPYGPLEKGDWNVHQIAVHTRDVDGLVYGPRVRRTLVEQNPVFANFDGDVYLAEHYSSKESLPDLLNGLVKNVDDLVKVLREMPPEGWSRTSRHETQGDGLTLQVWVERDLEHILEHLETVKQAKQALP